SSRTVPPPPPPPPPRPAQPPPHPPPATPPRRRRPAGVYHHTIDPAGGRLITALPALPAGPQLVVLPATAHHTTRRHPSLPAAGPATPPVGPPPFLAAAGEHAGVLLLPGQELTTDEGHANCFGAVGWVDFRRPADEWQAVADERGALLSVNHPWAGDCAWRRS